VVAAAVALVDAEGAAALSMRRLGRAVGVEAMTLYHHFPDKASIVDGVVAAIYAEVRLDGLPNSAPWTEQAAEAMRRFRTTLLKHPRALPLMSTRPVVGEAGWRAVELLMTIFRNGGLDRQPALRTLNCLASYTVGHCITRVGQAVADVPDVTTELELARVRALPPEEFPGVLWAIGDAAATYDPGAEFELGLLAMLDGLAGRYPGVTPGVPAGKEGV
jgi:AcrR family transcriptional regulator